MTTTQAATKAMTAIELDNVIRTLELSMKSHHATRHSIKNACRLVMQLLPDSTVKLNASTAVLVDFVDTALSGFKANRDELLREECRQEIIKKEAQKQQIKDLYFEYGIESLEEGVFDGKNSCIYSPLACPITYIGSDDHSVTIACHSRLQRVVACEEWASWQPHDFEAAYKKSPTTEHVCHDTDSYWTSNTVPVDRENQNEIALNFYSQCNNNEEVHVSYSTALYGDEWCEEVAGSDMLHSRNQRLAIGYACILPTPKPRMYRCTRNSAYRGHDVLGNTDISAKQGHYVEAYNEKEAIAKMGTMFPYDKLGFTATLWN